MGKHGAQGLALALIGLLFSTALAAQTPAGKTVNGLTNVRHAKINLHQDTRKDFFPKVQYVAPKPGVQVTPSEWDSLMRVVEAIEPVPQQRSPRSSALQPELAIAFEGNKYREGTPNDNDIAISNSGYIVSVINSTINVFDTLGELLHEVSLQAFSQKLDLPHGKYDPKVLFDPDAERFILVYLNGSLDSTSHIIVAFSQTDNPLEEWNIYALPGNPLKNFTWSDYPSIAVSKSDLFISINTFFNHSENNSGFYETTFWQVDKSDGYNGAGSLRTLYYRELASSFDRVFNLQPVRGAWGSYGDEMYLVTNRNRHIGTNDFALYHVKGSVASGHVELTYEDYVSSQNYGLPRNTPQPYRFVANPNEDVLKTNDCRVLDAVLLGNTIHFTGNTRTPRNANGIYHGKLTPGSNKTFPMEILGDDSFHFAYPSIEYAGYDTARDNAMLLSFCYSAGGLSDFPGMAAMFYKDNGYSNVIFTYKGNSRIHIIPGPDRWGDYTGSALLYSQPGTVWTSGNYGNLVPPSGSIGGVPRQANGTGIVKLQNPYPRSNNGPSTFAREGKVYPTWLPNNHVLTVEFEMPYSGQVYFDLYNLRGQLVERMLVQTVKEGDNRFSFTPAPLSSGMYILKLSTSKEVLLQQKIVAE